MARLMVSLVRPHFSAITLWLTSHHPLLFVCVPRIPKTRICKSFIRASE